jgi:hypothetical protein
MAVQGPKYLSAILVATVIALAVAQPAVAESTKRFQSEAAAPRVDYWQKREA